MTKTALAANGPLDWLNFFHADVTGGAGPVLAIYLMASQQWSAGRIGIVLTVGGIATVLARGPAGAFVEATVRKRSLIAASALVVGIAVTITAVVPLFWPVTIAQAAAGLADAVFPPAVAAISLGIFGRAVFSRRVGRNEAFNHLGNAVTAIVAGIAGYLIAPVAVLWVVVVLALASAVAVYKIDGNSIDHELARGADDGKDGDEPKRLGPLLKSRPLLLFTAAITLFHFANAAMLPLLGLSATTRRQRVMRHAGWLSITGVVVVVALALVVAAVPFVLPSEDVPAHKLAAAVIFVASYLALAGKMPASPWLARPSWWPRVFCRSRMPTRRSTATPSPCFSA
jgi:hypothetical protein